ncbi:MAG: Ig-like domain-containing protein [Nanobdellota archaeon]
MLLLLLPLSVSALEDDVELSTTFKDLDTCSCVPYEDSLELKNTGDFEVAYEIGIKGTDHVSLSRDLVVLKPGESDSIMAMVDPPCGEEREFSYEIIIETDSGLRKVYTKSVDSNKCDNIETEFLLGNSFSNDPCIATKFDMEVTNTGKHNEVYMMGTRDIPSDYVEFTQDDFFLQPGESETVSAYVSYPCDVYGLQEAKFTVESKDANIKEEYPFFVDINRKYNYSADFGKYDQDGADYSSDGEYAFCENDVSAIPLRVNNEVYLSNTYKIETLDNEDWIFPENSSVSVHGNESGMSNIVFRPDDGDRSTYTFPVRITSVRGDLVSEKNLTVKVEDCYSHEISMPEKAKSCCGENVYEATLTNTASRNNTITLSSEHGLSEEQVTLAPSDSKSISVNVDKDCGNISSEEVSVETRAPANHTESASMTADFVSREECHELDIELEHDKLFYDKEGMVLKIKNTGLRASDYDIDAETPSWMEYYKGETSLEPGMTTTVWFESSHDNSTPAGVYNITLDIEADNGYVFSKDLPFELKDKTWVDKAELFFKYNKVLVVVLILILFGLVYWIASRPRKPKRHKKDMTKSVKGKAPKRKKRKKRKGSKTWILVFLIILLFLVGGYLFYQSYAPAAGKVNETVENETEDKVVEKVNQTVPEEERLYEHVKENNLTGSPQYQIWDKNKVHEVDLDSMFKDPDGDELTFSSTEPENVNVTISEGTAYLEPKEGWHGVDFVKFRAEDEAGASVTTPEMTLLVRDKETGMLEGLWDKVNSYFKVYLIYIVFGVVILIILILIMSMDTKKLKK